MAFKRYATVESTLVLLPTVSPSKKVSSVQEAGFEFPKGYPRAGYLYTVVRAISARVNRNFDGFPASQLKAAYSTFNGRPVFVNHANEDHKRTRGVVLASKWNESGTDKYITLLNEVDARNFPKLAYEIETGGLDAVSMGTDVERSICSYCENVATVPEELCSHVLHHKGKILSKTMPDGHKEDCLVYEELYGLNFFEISYVFDPADETAMMKDVIKVSSSARDGSTLDQSIQDRLEKKSFASGEQVMVNTKDGPIQGTVLGDQNLGGVLIHLVGGTVETYPKEQVSESTAIDSGNPPPASAPPGPTMASRRTRRRVGYGEDKAPTEVDTLKGYGPCPQCQTDGFDGSHCDLCDYTAPIPGLDDPNTEMAQQMDLRQKEQQSMTPVPNGNLPPIDPNQPLNPGPQMFQPQSSRQGGRPPMPPRKIDLVKRNLAEAQKRLADMQGFDTLMGPVSPRGPSGGTENFNTLLWEQKSPEPATESTEEVRNQSDHDSVDKVKNPPINEGPMENINVMSLPSNRSYRVRGDAASEKADFDQWEESTEKVPIPARVRKPQNQKQMAAPMHDPNEVPPPPQQMPLRWQTGQRTAIRFDDGSKVCDNCGENCDRLMVNPDSEGDPTISLCDPCYSALEKFSGDEQMQEALERVKLYLDKQEQGGGDPNQAPAAGQQAAPAPAQIPVKASRRDMRRRAEGPTNPYKWVNASEDGHEGNSEDDRLDNGHIIQGNSHMLWDKDGKTEGQGVYVHPNGSWDHVYLGRGSDPVASGESGGHDAAWASYKKGAEKNNEYYDDDDEDKPYIPAFPANHAEAKSQPGKRLPRLDDEEDFGITSSRRASTTGNRRQGARRNMNRNHSAWQDHLDEQGIHMNKSPGPHGCPVCDSPNMVENEKQGNWYCGECGTTLDDEGNQIADGGDEGVTNSVWSSRRSSHRSRPPIRRRGGDNTKYDTADHVNVETPVAGSDSDEARTEQWSREKMDKNGPVTDQPLGGDSTPLNSDMLPRSSRFERASAVDAIRLAEAYINAGLASLQEKYSKVAEFERLPKVLIQDRIRLLERVGSVRATGSTQARPRTAVPTSRTASRRAPSLARRSGFQTNSTSAGNLEQFPDSATFL